jgi:hypothetical protein
VEEIILVEDPTGVEEIILVEDLTEVEEEMVLEKDLTKVEEMVLEKDLTKVEEIILEESQPTKEAVDEITRIILLINMGIRAIGTVNGNHRLKDSSA